MDTFYNDSVDSSNLSYPAGISLTFSPYATALYIVTYAPLWFCIISGNILLISAFVCNKELRKVQYYLLFSLAVTDLMTGIVALPLWVFARLVTSPIVCFASTRFNFFLPSINFCGSSIWHLFAITVDRCLSLMFPLKYPRLVTARRVAVVIGIIWMMSISIACLPLYYPSSGSDQWVCSTVDFYENEVDTLYLAISGFIPGFLICMIILYTIMLRIAMKHIKVRRTLTNQTDQTFRDAQSRKRGIVTMAVVVGAFGICWLPTSMKGFYEAYVPTTKNKLITVQTFSEYFSFLNSMMNPLIYGYFNRHFKIGFKVVLRKCACRPTKLKASQSAQNLSGSGNISLSRSVETLKSGNC